MIYDNHQFLTAGKVRGNDSAWTDIMNLIFFPPNAWLNLVCCSQRCHWRFISSRRASQSREKILLLSCIVWSVIVWNCILPHSLPFLLHQFCSKIVRKTKQRREKQCCTCSFKKIFCDIMLGSSWCLLNSGSSEVKNASFCHSFQQKSHYPPNWRSLITYWFWNFMFYFLSPIQNFVSGLLPKDQNRYHVKWFS